MLCSVGWCGYGASPPSQDVPGGTALSTSAGGSQPVVTVSGWCWDCLSELERALSLGTLLLCHRAVRNGSDLVSHALISAGWRLSLQGIPGHEVGEVTHSCLQALMTRPSYSVHLPT